MAKSFGVVARIKAPKGYKGVWVNVYNYGQWFQFGGSYGTRSQADSIAKPYRHECIYVHVKKRFGD